jgi:uncharacterized OsmC-like protein
VWIWVLIPYLAVLIALIGCAGYVALFVADHRRSNRAFRILKIALAAVTACTGVVALRLHDAGLL